ncbi:MAG: response regulator transcription factor [Lachnospiraceae bacterium]|nr:response regulator transcription factor [Lachnospiraceae bacterium]
MKILAVDDEPGILRVIRKALEKEYEVVTVCRPSESLPRTFGDMDLIILDVMMPGEDGYEILQRIREDATCPILFLSAKALEEDVVYGLALGADDYIRKPFSVAELRARISAHIRRDKRENESCIRSGEIALYPTSRKVKAGEDEVSLTKSEFDIMLLLIRNKGQAFSKEQIYEKVYGFEKSGDESAITEHVKNLRKKLSAKGYEPIETVWGIGYKWKKEE